MHKPRVIKFDCCMISGIQDPTKHLLRAVERYIFDRLLLNCVRELKIRYQDECLKVHWVIHLVQCRCPQVYLRQGGACLVTS